jgi:hypothetical protein
MRTGISVESSRVLRGRGAYVDSIHVTSVFQLRDLHSRSSLPRVASLGEVLRDQLHSWSIALPFVRVYSTLRMCFTAIRNIISLPSLLRQLSQLVPRFWCFHMPHSESRIGQCVYSLLDFERQRFPYWK